jgi:tRNA threonylcarbamoyladenosine biosynthesis protein TsaE
VVDLPVRGPVVEEKAVGLDRLTELAERLAAVLLPGDLVVFFGPLGAGKTTMIRVIARGLGVTDPVRSPSFTIANIYAAPVTVNHLDLYRLDEIGEEDALALEEYRSGDAVTLVEWPEAGIGRLGRPSWIVRLGHETAETRTLEIQAGDAESEARWTQTDPGDKDDASASRSEGRHPR